MKRDCAVIGIHGQKVYSIKGSTNRKFENGRIIHAGGQL